MGVADRGPALERRTHHPSWRPELRSRTSVRLPPGSPRDLKNTRRCHSRLSRRARADSRADGDSQEPSPGLSGKRPGQHGRGRPSASNRSASDDCAGCCSLNAAEVAFGPPSVPRPRQGLRHPNMRECTLGPKKSFGDADSGGTIHPIEWSRGSSPPTGMRRRGRERRATIDPSGRPRRPGRRPGRPPGERCGRPDLDSGLDFQGRTFRAGLSGPDFQGRTFRPSPASGMCGTASGKSLGSSDLRQQAASNNARRHP